MLAPAANSYGMSVTTLEEVFLRVANGTADANSRNTIAKIGLQRQSSLSSTMKNAATAEVGAFDLYCFLLIRVILLLVLPLDVGFGGACCRCVNTIFQETRGRVLETLVLSRGALFLGELSVRLSIGGVLSVSVENGAVLCSRRQPSVNCEILLPSKPAEKPSTITSPCSGVCRSFGLHSACGGTCRCDIGRGWSWLEEGQPWLHSQYKSVRCAHEGSAPEAVPDLQAGQENVDFCRDRPSALRAPRYHYLGVHHHSRRTFPSADAPGTPLFGPWRMTEDGALVESGARLGWSGKCPRPRVLLRDR